VDTVALHLHSIADAEHVPSIVDPEATHGELLTEVRVKKKIKKDLTGVITWDIKGVLTRKTKGKYNVKSC
jgi:hypothetical protein